MATVFGLDAATWTALGTVVNAVTVIVLAIITAWYANSARRQARAAEAQAGAAIEQAKAAQAQAAASQQQVNVALQTLRALQERIQDERTGARIAVANAVQSAISNIEYWEGQGTLESRAKDRAIPASISLLPANHHHAVDSARLISADVASSLNRAFDLLTRAESHILGMRITQSESVHLSFVTRQSDETREFLATAKSILQKCQTDVYQQ